MNNHICCSEWNDAFEKSCNNLQCSYGEEKQGFKQTFDRKRFRKSCIILCLTMYCFISKNVQKIAGLLQSTIKKLTLTYKKNQLNYKRPLML